MLLAAVRASGESVDARRDRLREVAGLCESNLRDIDGAIGAWKQLLALDRSDETARQSLTRLLERTQRWDDLANLYEQEENGEIDLEKKLVLQKKLATLHETKRKDLGAAAEVWERIANVTPEDEQSITTASKMFVKAGAPDRAAQVIAANAPSVTDSVARSALLERLGELYEEIDDPARAGDAYADAAGDGPNRSKLWEAAERCFVAAERWDRAGQAAVQRAELESDAKGQARHFARSADYLGRGGDEAGALVNLVQAAELEPTNEEYAQQLADRYTASLRWDDLVQLLLRRSENVADASKRLALRRQAADLYANQLGDKDAARETWRKILEDGDDEETAEHLVDDAIERGDHAEATELLQRLEKAAKTAPEKARIALREAELVADAVGDVEAAIVRYERIVKEIDPSCRLALQAIADLQEARDNAPAAANALERELKLVDRSHRARAESACVSRTCTSRIGDAELTIRALDVVRSADPDDFDALTRLSDLCEKTEKWDRVAELLAQRIEIEGDEAEAALLTRKLSSVLADKLNRGDEALGDAHGDGRSGRRRRPNGVRRARRSPRLARDRRDQARRVVARRQSRAPSGSSHLRGAFERFAEVGRDQDAVKVATELVAQQGRRPAARRAAREARDQDEGPRRAVDGPRPHRARPDGNRARSRARPAGGGPGACRRSPARGDPARRGGAHERASGGRRGVPEATGGARRQAERRGRPLRAAGHALRRARAIGSTRSRAPPRSRRRTVRSIARAASSTSRSAERPRKKPSPCWSEPLARATSRPAETRSGGRSPGRSSKGVREPATEAGRGGRCCGARR